MTPRARAFQCLLVLLGLVPSAPAWSAPSPAKPTFICPGPLCPGPPPVPLTPARVIGAVVWGDNRGPFGAGDTVPINIFFDNPIVVNTTGGVPSLLLNTGPVNRAARYESTFANGISLSYVVQPGDNSPGLDYVSTSALSLNGGSILDTTGAAAVLTLPAVGSHLGPDIIVVEARARSFAGTGPRGPATAAFTGGGPGCIYSKAAFVPVAGDAASPPAGSAPAGYTFPHGLLDFATAGCAAGSTLAFTITYPEPLDPSTIYWKYGPTTAHSTPHWYAIPATIAGNVATFTITDGGPGDDDLAANGIIVDQGGPGVPGTASAIPATSDWMLALTALLIALSGFAALARRRANVT